ncbi:MAG: hypothetical protein NC200_08490 [Candidatus Gastranaerophilales bacterium]|nr:hypothetical protein [Candidatus Gastranaerophilales bacterium]
MINHKRIADFLIELIRYADDSDIETFLRNCSAKLIEDTEKENCDTYYYKTWLLNYLFEYVYGFIEPKIPSLPPLVYENGKLIRGLPIVEYPNFKTDVSNYTHLYLHLYALCECYYSYLMVFSNEKKVIKQLIEKSNKDIKLGAITDKDRTKILNLLINSYTENKFYYYFYDNELVKLEIVSERVNHRLEDCYRITKYNLVDKDGVTYITSNNNVVYTALKQKLVRNQSGEVDFATVDFENYFAGLLNNIEFQEIKSIHKQIVKAITPIKREKYCKCCNPNGKNIRNSLCTKCIDLLSELNKLKRMIDEDEVNDYIVSIKSLDFENVIFSIADKDIKSLRAKRQSKLNQIIDKLVAEVKIEQKENGGDFKIYYDKLAKKIEVIKQMIIDSFDR